MKKADLVTIISDKTGVTKKDSAVMVDLVYSEITVKDRAGRVGINPAKKGEKVVIPATRVPSFKAGKALKEAVK